MFYTVNYIRNQPTLGGPFSSELEAHNRWWRSFQLSLIEDEIFPELGQLAGLPDNFIEHVIEIISERIRAETKQTRKTTNYVRSRNVLAKELVLAAIEHHPTLRLIESLDHLVSLKGVSLESFPADTLLIKDTTYRHKRRAIKLQ
jgi:hypothetical protein